MADQPLTWLFQVIDDLSAPVDKMSASLERIEGTLNKSAGKLDSVEKSAAGAAEGSGMFGLKLNATLEIAGKGIEILKGLAEGAIDFGREVLKAAAGAEKLDLQLKQLLGAEGAKEVGDFLDRVGKTSSFTPSQLKTAIQPLLRAGFKGKELERVFAAAEDVSAGDLGTLQSAIFKFSNIALKGGISDRDIIGMGVKVDEFYKSLGKVTGHTAKAAEKLAATGAIKPDILLGVLEQAIANTEGGKLGTKALEQGTTLDAILTRLADIPGNYFEEFGKSAAFEPVKAFLSKLVGILSPDGAFGQRAIRVVSEVFSAMFGGLTSENAGAKVEDLVGTVVGFLEKIPPFVREVRTVFEGWFNAAGGGEGITKLLGSVLSLAGSMIRIWLTVQRVLAPVYGLLIYIEAGLVGAIANIVEFAMSIDTIATGALFEFFEFVGNGIAGIILAFFKLPEQVWNAIVDLVKPFTDLPGQMWEAGVNAAQGFLDGLKSMAGALVDLPLQLGGSVVGAFKQVLGIASPSTVFAAFGENTVAGFVEGIEEAAPNAERAIAGIGSGTTAGFGGGAPLPAAGAGGSGASFSVTIGDVVIGGSGDADTDGKEAAARIKGILQSELQAFFQRLAVEQGVG